VTPNASHVGVWAENRPKREETLAHAKAVDDTADDHLRQMPRDDLKHSTNGIGSEPERDGLFAAELVAEREGEDGATKGAERETAGRDARDVGLFGLGEPVLEVGRDQHAREDALVIAEP
jgi:hypothetical protein